jgi:hypothetical protein
VKRYKILYPTKRAPSNSITKLLAIILLFVGGCDRDDQWAFDPGYPTPTDAKRNEILMPPSALGRASAYAALASNTIESSDESIIQGDVGINLNSIKQIQTESEGSTTSLKGILSGAVYTSSARVEQAINDAALLYYSIINRPPDIVYNSIIQINEQTFTPGIYYFPSWLNLSLNGTITLDFQGNDQALFIFQVGGSLTAMANSGIVAINTADNTNICDNVIWAVSTSATIAGDTFIGNVIALGDIAMGKSGNASGITTMFGSIISLRGSLKIGSCKISKHSKAFKTTYNQTIEYDHFVTGTGTIEQFIIEKENIVKEKNVATFGLSYGIKDGRYWGIMSLVDYTNKDTRLKSISIKAFTVINLTTREIKGVAKVNNRDFSDYTLIIKDNGGEGNADYFDISLSNGFRASGPLIDGNIQFHIHSSL